MLLSVGSAAVLWAAAADFKAGAAARNLTPKAPVRLAGYAARNRPHEGVRQDIWVKALALEDARGTRLALVTADLIGFPAELADAIAKDLEAAHKLPRAAVMLTASHTHSAAVVRANLADMYDVTAAEADAVAAFTERVRTATLEAVAEALGHLAPATLRHGEGKATFAMNRRNPTGAGVALASHPAGPVDWSVPTLVVEGADGKPLAAAFGYACHNTTLGDYQLNGDYAGFAQAEWQRRHPGALALFWTGCGGDANPEPRGQPAHAETHGAALANAVDRVLAGKPKPIAGAFRADYSRIALPFDKLPARSFWEQELGSKIFAARNRAKRHLALLDAGQPIPAAYERYPVQQWRLGDGPSWTALGGEVVVGYAQRLKAELAERQPDRPVWVAGYANDVMAYIPTKKILAEGGYEADSSMIYYGMPTRWAPAIEDLIVAEAKRLAEKP